MPYQNLIEPTSLSWGSGSVISGSVYLGGAAILAVGVPGTWTTAPLTFQASTSSVAPAAATDWRTVYVNGAQWGVTPAVGTSLYYMSVADAPSLYWVRGVSGAAVGTAQTAAVSLELLTRPV